MNRFAFVFASAALFLLGAACAQPAPQSDDADSPPPAAAPAMEAETIAPSAREVPRSMDQVRLSFAPVVDRAAPAVVNIYSRRVVQQRSPFPAILFSSVSSAAISACRRSACRTRSAPA